MVYTVTFNPALDYIIKIKNFEIGKINRSNQEIILPGGKGINVSIVLNSLGIETTTLGFIAGFTGNKIKEEIEKYNIKTDFVKLKNSNSRINVKIRDVSVGFSRWDPFFVKDWTSMHNKKVIIWKY